MDSGGQKKLLKLSEESLMREPEEVFDLLEKIGEGYVHYPMCIQYHMTVDFRIYVLSSN